MVFPSTGVVDEPLSRSRDRSRPHPLITVTTLDHCSPLSMGYEDWNEIEDEDQDELQDASVGLHLFRPSNPFTQSPHSGSRVNAT